MGSEVSAADQRAPAFHRHVKRLYPDLDGLLAAAEQVRALVATPGWLVLTRLLEEETATIDRRLDGGSEPLMQAEYALAHGRRGGLRGADEAAGAILRHAEMRLAQQQAKHENGAAEPAAVGG